MKPAVLLDRDGTIIHEVSYLDRVELIEFFPWTTDTIRALNRAGFPVVVVTNQPGIARGFFDEALVGAVHREITSRLALGGATIDAYYHCPHHPEGTVAAFARVCDCRKPACGLAERAAREMGLDLRRSYVVGDRWKDIGLARAVGARGILVRTGSGRLEELRPSSDLSADAVVDNLAAAASWILTNR